jgi:hypothetical protein
MTRSSFARYTILLMAYGIALAAAATDAFAQTETVPIVPASKHIET